MDNFKVGQIVKHATFGSKPMNTLTKIVKVDPRCITLEAMDAYRWRFCVYPQDFKMLTLVIDVE